MQKILLNIFEKQIPNGIYPWTGEVLKKTFCSLKVILFPIPALVLYSVYLYHLFVVLGEV